MSPSAPPKTKNSAWSVRPLIPGKWRTLSLADACAVIGRFTAYEAANEYPQLTANHTAFQQVRILPLCSLLGWLLAEMETLLDDGNTGFVAALMGPGGRILPMNWSSDPIISAARGSLPWPPDDAQAREFCLLFCNLLSSGEQRFHIAETLADVDLAPDLPTKHLKAFRKALKPLTLAREKNEVYANATMIYAGQVAAVRLQILPTCIIEMSDDNALGTAHVKNEELRGLIRIVHPTAFEQV